MHSISSNQPQTSREAVQLRRVHTITDRFSMANTYLVDEERLFVIDPSSEGNVRLLFKYVRHVLHRPLHDIDLIVLTYLHPDQRMAAEALRHSCRAPIAASAGVEQLLTERRERKISVWLHDVEGLPDHPDWRVIACPGHTLESLCLYNPFTRELLCGDTVSTVRGGTPLVRGVTNPAQLEETIRTLRSLPVSYLYPSHGRAILSHRPLSKLDVQW